MDFAWFTKTKLTADGFAELIIALDKGVINSTAAQEVFLDMVQTGRPAMAIIEEKGLKQIGSEQELEGIVLKVVANNPDNVALYKGGNQRVFMFFVGQAMKETKGKGNPTVIQELFKKHLG